YAFSYYSGIQGAPSAPTSKVKDISGIQAPDDNTLVLQLKQPVGILANANALGLPCTIPVPKNYAAKFEQEPVDIRPASGLHRAVHARGRGLRHGAEGRVPAGEADLAGA